MLHPLLETRWSPRDWDPTHQTSAADVDALLEAARWAPSAANWQPWSFIVGHRGDRTHARLLRHVAPSSARWTPDASLLVANVCHRYLEGTTTEPFEFAHYDLGQAVAHMTVQARALGLQTRQFRAFDRDALAHEFNVPAHWEITTMTAMGRAQSTSPPDPSTSEPSSLRARREREDLRWDGSARP